MPTAISKFAKDRSRDQHLDVRFTYYVPVLTRTGGVIIPATWAGTNMNQLPRTGITLLQALDERLMPVEPDVREALADLGTLPWEFGWVARMEGALGRPSTPWGAFDSATEATHSLFETYGQGYVDDVDLRITPRDLAVILAGLRCLQQVYDQCCGDISDDLQDVLDDAVGPDGIALPNEIDNLCADINGGHKSATR